MYLISIVGVLSACSEIQNQTNIDTLSQVAALQAAKSVIEKSFLNDSPILPASTDRFPAIDTLPGTDFKPKINTKVSFSYDKDGNLLLNPGDYVIPVMTYCMRASGTSPEEHTYQLAKMGGARAKNIRNLNLKSVPKFSVKDVQILSWSIQAGLSYEEMTSTSQKIIDDVLPEMKSELRDSFFASIEKEWNKISERSAGLVPTLENATPDFLNEFGSAGKKIEEIREFRKKLSEVGNDYSALSSLIDISRNIGKKAKLTQWSQISDRVYARFLISGHYHDVGEIQIRILSKNQNRKINSANEESVAVDITSWMADPGDDSVQPLSFSPIVGYAGVATVPELAAVPTLAAVVLGAVLATKYVDWDSFFKLQEIVANSKNSRVREILDEGTRVLNEEHDEMEKPLREAGIIDRKMRIEKPRGDKNTRQYQKQGGKEQLEKDFQKVPGNKQEAQGGTEVKDLDNGNKLVKRSNPREGSDLTLEVQPSETADKSISKLRVKVRYLP